MFCDRLKEVRKLQNITQSELASAIGMSRQTITKYESGERFPDEITLVNIANYFSVSLDYLLDRNIGNAEQIATAITTNLNKIGLLDAQHDAKVEFIVNAMEALIKEFEKYENKQG